MVLRDVLLCVACATLFSGCGGLLSAPPSPRSETKGPSRPAASSHAILRTELHFAEKRLHYAEAQRDESGAPSRGLRARGAHGGTYWFTDDATLTRSGEYVLVRDYGATFVFKKADLEVRDNTSNTVITLDLLASERAESPVATTIRSGHIAHRTGKTICPECFIVQPPALRARSHQRAPRIYVPGTVQLCDSAITGTCDACPTFFSISPCCDLAAEDCPDFPEGVGGGSGYYDQYGNFVSDMCSSYEFDAELYALCAAYGFDGVQFDALSRCRCPVVQVVCSWGVSARSEQPFHRLGRRADSGILQSARQRFDSRERRSLLSTHQSTDVWPIGMVF